PSRRQFFGFLSALAGLPIVGRLAKAQAAQVKPNPKVEIIWTSYTGHVVTTYVYDSKGFVTDRVTRGTTTYSYCPCRPAIADLEANRTTIVYDVSGKRIESKPCEPRMDGDER